MLKFPNDIMIFYGIYVQVIDNISWNLVFALFRPFLKLNWNIFCIVLE